MAIKSHNKKIINIENQELISGNLLISKFMNEEYKEYHSSYDIIMPVIKKIKTIEKDWPISSDFVLSLPIYSDLDIIWVLIVELLKIITK